MTRPVLFCGDPHGRFDQVFAAVDQTEPGAVVFLGDMEPLRPLHVELKSLIERELPLWYIHGNHDADSDELWMRVWGSELAERNVHGRVVELPDGRRLAGLGGVFRETVWHPVPGAARAGVPAFRTRAQHAKSTPRQDRWGSGPHRRHWGSIYPEDVDGLASLQTDILITHEAPGYHPHGFELLDTLAQSMGAAVAIHGHHHDALDSSARWEAQGFRSYGVGLRGVCALWPDDRWEVVIKGELDDRRSSR